MSLVTILPVFSQDSTLPTVATADLSYFTEYDPTSYDHWIFDKNSSVDLTGRNAGRLLVAQSTAPTYSANYLTMNNGVGKGLATDLIDSSATPQHTLCAVVRESYTGSVAKVAFGTLDTGSSGGTGGALFMSGTAPARGVYETYRGVTSSDNSGATVALNSWYFVALSADFSGATKYVRTLVGGQTGHEANASTPYLPSSRAFALGSGYYTASNPSVLDFAEFIVYQRAMTLADLAAVYAASKARMAARGISVA